MAQQPPIVISNWYHLTENLQESPKTFYSSLEETIKKRQIPDVKVTRIDYREGGILSAKREYLRVQRKELVFDICSAPFGNGFFVSWWLGETIGLFWALIIMIPFVGGAILQSLRPHTYYRLDTALMFQETVRSAVLEVLDATTKAKGLRELSEAERKPILREFFKH